MKMKDILIFNNCPFVCDLINEDMSSKFDNFFNTLENQHPYNTRGRKIMLLSKHYLTQQPTV